MSFFPNESAPRHFLLCPCRAGDGAVEPAPSVVRRCVASGGHRCGPRSSWTGRCWRHVGGVRREAFAAAARNAAGFGCSAQRYQTSLSGYDTGPNSVLETVDHHMQGPRTVIGRGPESLTLGIDERGAGRITKQPRLELPFSPKVPNSPSPNRSAAGECRLDLMLGRCAGCRVCPSARRGVGHPPGRSASAIGSTGTENPLRTQRRLLLACGFALRGDPRSRHALY